jgi:hypothetical protein
VPISESAGSSDRDTAVIENHGMLFRHNLKDNSLEILHFVSFELYSVKPPKTTNLFWVDRWTTIVSVSKCFCTPGKAPD